MTTFKRTTKKTGSKTRNTVTTRNLGNSTISNSVKTGNTNYTYTTQGSKSYVTQTIKNGDGSISKKRISSNSPSKNKSSGLGGILGVIFFIVIVVFSLFG